jgi:RNA polymerase-binding transcription factor DksA
MQQRCTSVFVRFCVMTVVTQLLVIESLAQDRGSPAAPPKVASSDAVEKEVEAHYRAMAEKIVRYSNSAIVSPMSKSLKKQLGETESQLSAVKKAKVGVEQAAKFKANPTSAPLAYSSAEARTAVVEELNSKVNAIERALRAIEDNKYVIIDDSGANIPVQEWTEMTITGVLEPNEVTVRTKYGISKILRVLEPDVVQQIKADLKANPLGIELPFPKPLVVTREGSQEREYSPGKKYNYEVLKNLDRDRLEKLLTKGGKRVIWDAPVSKWQGTGYSYEEVLKTVGKL